MIVYDTTNRTAYGLAQGEGEALWFLGSLQTIKASAASTGGRLAIIEVRAVEGPASPLHVHHNESEWWYVLEGERAIWAAGEVIEAPAGSFVYGPVDVPHTFSVVSAQARFLLGTEPAGFEAFMRACSEPAQSPTLPPPGTTTPDPARLAALSAEYGIEVLGPPGLPA
jgi:mannose-6-phosphate isomerase-like protein (cupin superfamily)